MPRKIRSPIFREYGIRAAVSEDYQGLIELWLLL